MRKKGFTLIELLIVVAIIAILAAIAIPNFLQAQVRSKVARAAADMRSMATGLESYYVDSNAYPWAQYAGGPPGGRSYFDDRLLNLTTPVAYMTTLPDDPFATFDTQYPFPNNKGTATYEYEDRYADSEWGDFDKNAAIDNMPNYDRFFTPNTQWHLMTAGPDQHNTFQYGTNGGIVVPAGESNAVVLYTYDPSNGTVSNGDIWRYGP